MQATKFGIHFMNDGQDECLDLLNRIPMVTIKFAEMALVWTKDPNKIKLLDEAHTKGTLIVGRRVEQPPNIDADNMELEALRYYNGIGTDSFTAFAKTFPQVDIWEGPNEIVIQKENNGIVRMQKYAEFLYEFALLVKSNTGKRAGLGGWAVGGPEPDLWQYYGKALQAVLDLNAVLTRHSYGPDPHDVYTTLRHRMDNDAFTALDKKYAYLPVIISEAGYDPLNNKKIPQDWKKAFKDINGYWNNYLKPLTDELGKDPEVLGLNLFTCGNGGSSSWDRFDVAHLPLADAILANPPAPIPVVGPPVPAPVPPVNPYPAYKVANCIALNIRQFPWTGTPVPAVMMTLGAGATVHVYATIKYGAMTSGWALISADGNAWVSLYYLAPA